MKDIENQANKPEDNYAQCNILLIGKTGVGKSSFANYLFGNDRFTTGVGEPVTSWEENFQNYPFLPYDKESFVKINVYDSVGLEPDNYEEWYGKLKGFLEFRSSADNPNDQMHILLYVLSGPGARIETIEIESLKEISTHFKLPVSILISQCDKADKEKLNELEKVIIKETGLSPIRVCSKSIRMRDGTKELTSPYGKDQVIEKIINASIEKVGFSLRETLYHQASKIIKNIRNQFIDQFDEKMDVDFLSAYKKNPKRFNNWFWQDIKVPNLRDRKIFIGRDFDDYHNFLNLLSSSSTQEGSDLLRDFNSSFNEVEKIINLKSLTDETQFANQDLTQYFAGNSFDAFGEKLNDFLDLVFQRGRNQKDRAKEKIRDSFDSIDDQLKTACRIDIDDQVNTGQDLGVLMDEFFDEQRKKILRTNIAVIGAEGAGKSALISRIIDRSIDAEEQGDSVKQGINKYKPKEIPIALYDTKGYPDSDDGVMNFDKKTIAKFRKMNKGDLQDHIHLFWYCISLQNNTVSSYDIQFISKLVTADIKICVVFTQRDLDKSVESGKSKIAQSMEHVIRNIRNLANLRFFETCATVSDQRFDLDRLVDWSSRHPSDEQLRMSFLESQKASVPDKKKRGYGIVTATSAIAAATGAVPIPLADAPILSAQQITMCLTITKIFWGSANTGDVVGSILKTQLISIAGQNAARSLIKFIPGLGSMVSASTAAAFTAGLGTVIVEINANAFMKYLDTGEYPDWKEIFSQDILTSQISRNMKKKRLWKKEKNE